MHSFPVHLTVIMEACLRFCNLYYPEAHGISQVRRSQKCEPSIPHCLGKRKWRAGRSALMNLHCSHKRDFRYHNDIFPCFIFALPLDPFRVSVLEFCTLLFTQPLPFSTGYCYLSFPNIPHTSVSPLSTRKTSIIQVFAPSPLWNLLLSSSPGRMNFSHTVLRRVHSYNNHIFWISNVFRTYHGNMVRFVELKNKYTLWKQCCFGEALPETAIISLNS